LLTGAEEAHSDYNKAGPSQTKKRTRVSKSDKARKKKKTDTQQEKAAEAGIDFDLVCSHPKITYLYWCIDKINSLQHGDQLSKKGIKETLQNRIYDYLGVPQNDRSPKPLSASQQRLNKTITFSNIDRGYKRSLKWADDSKDTSSVRSFEDCSCERCEGKPWHPPDYDDDNDNDNGDDNRDENINDTGINIDIEHIPPKVPPISSIEGAIQQVESGLIEKIHQKYHGTAHWKNLKKIYSERNVCIYTIIKCTFHYTNKNILIIIIIIIAVKRSYTRNINVLEATYNNFWIFILKILKMRRLTKG